VVLIQVAEGTWGVGHCRAITGRVFGTVSSSGRRRRFFEEEGKNYPQKNDENPKS